MENSEARCAAHLPLAIATVPMQAFRRLYTAEQGWQRGTVFEELDLPFEAVAGEDKPARLDFLDECEAALGRVSFVMDELRLFLDTHPECKGALEQYKRARQYRDRLLEQLDAQGKPVNFYNAGGECRWNWPEQPWPWEKEE